MSFHPDQKVVFHYYDVDIITPSKLKWPDISFHSSSSFYDISNKSSFLELTTSNVRNISDGPHISTIELRAAIFPFERLDFYHISWNTELCKLLLAKFTSPFCNQHGHCSMHCLPDVFTRSQAPYHRVRDPRCSSDISQARRHMIWKFNETPFDYDVINIIISVNNFKLNEAHQCHAFRADFFTKSQVSTVPFLHPFQARFVTSSANNYWLQ